MHFRSFLLNLHYNLSQDMKKERKQVGKKPYGFCKQIADIVGSDQYYVSKVLKNPDTHKGDQAKRIKQVAQEINSSNEKIKAALLAAQSQNTMV